MIDSHAHIFIKPLNIDTDDIVSSAKEAGLHALINVGVDLNSSKKSITLSEKYPECWAAVGIHPNYRVESKDYDNTMSELGHMLNHPKVIAIGETGLDNYHKTTSHEEQVRLFRLHLDLARETGYPVVSHIREAYDDFRRVFADYFDIQGVLHAFGADEDFLDWALKNTSLYFGIGGPVTFKNFRNTSVVEKIPLNRLLLETDCPYMAPHPYRGKTNKPSYIPIIAQKLAEIYQIEISELSRITDKNTTNLFGIPKPIRGSSQVFLKSKGLLDKTADVFEIDENQPIIEIGAGPATLTSRLKARYKRTYAIEPDLSVYNEVDDVVLIPSGVERVSFAEISKYEKSDLIVFGNIPYHITSPILFQILENRKFVKKAALLIQKEVALRLAAKVGTSEYGVPTILIGNHYILKREFDVPAGAFRPIPDVTSSVISMVRRDKPLYDNSNNKYFEKIVRFSFTQRRKMIRKSLKQFINESIPTSMTKKRPEELTVEDFGFIADTILQSRQK